MLDAMCRVTKSLMNDTTINCKKVKEFYLLMVVKTGKKLEYIVSQTI